MLEINSIGRYGIIGKTGSGKSNSTFVLLENLRKRGQPLIVLDHKGEYQNLPNVQNIRASEYQAGTLPMRLRNSNASIVVDLRGHRAIKRWVGNFINACLNIPRKYPILIAIEEAHNYCPQRGKMIDSKMAITNLASEGRSKGYGFALISQNLAKLDKEAIKQCDFLYIHRHTFKNDISYLAELIGDEQVLKVKGLADGEYIFFNMKDDPGPPIQMPLAETKKTGYTPTPQAVRENTKTFYDDTSLGAVSGQYYYGQTQPAVHSDKYLIMIIVIVIIGIGVLGFFVWKGLKDEDQPITPEADHEW